MGAGQWCPFDEIHNCFILKPVLSSIVVFLRPFTGDWRLGSILLLKKITSFFNGFMLLAHSLERVDGPVWLSLGSNL